MKIDFTKKVVLVTGGSRGIGAACVKMFIESGADVAFTYHSNKKAADKVVKAFLNKSKIKAYKSNIISEENIQILISEIIKDFGKIDILVNNAGIWKKGEIEKMKLKDWEETININLNLSFLFTKYSVVNMKKRKWGRIINITSTAGQRGEAEYSHYAASKGGMISFTKSLASELGNFGITVNSVAPGWVLTDMTSSVFNNKSVTEKIKQNIPLNRIATADDIAGPVIFLASDLAKHITGEILNVNGGSVLCG